MSLQRKQKEQRETPRGTTNISDTRCDVRSWHKLLPLIVDESTRADSSQELSPYAEPDHLECLHMSAATLIGRRARALILKWPKLTPNVRWCELNTNVILRLIYHET